MTAKRAPWAKLDELLPETVNGREKPPFPGPPAFSSWTYEHPHVDVQHDGYTQSFTVEPGQVYSLPAGTSIQYLHVPSWVQPQRVAPGPYPWLSPEGDVRCGRWEVHAESWDAPARRSLKAVAGLGPFTVVHEFPAVDDPDAGQVIIHVKLGAGS